jgi:hypothetical protein
VPNVVVSTCSGRHSSEPHQLLDDREERADQPFTQLRATRVAFGQ